MSWGRYGYFSSIFTFIIPYSFAIQFLHNLKLLYVFYFLIFEVVSELKVNLGMSELIIVGELGGAYELVAVLGARWAHNYLCLI